MILEVDVSGTRYCRAGADEGVVDVFVSYLNVPQEPGGSDLAATMLSVTGFTHGPSRLAEEQLAVDWERPVMGWCRVT